MGIAAFVVARRHRDPVAVLLVVAQPVRVRVGQVRAHAVDCVSGAADGADLDAVEQAVPVHVGVQEAVAARIPAAPQ